MAVLAVAARTIMHWNADDCNQPRVVKKISRCSAPFFVHIIGTRLDLAASSGVWY
jgi:hypothetical protein